MPDGADRLDETPSGSNMVAAAGGGAQKLTISRSSGPQPPKSFVDSEDNREDLSEPNPLLD